MELKLSSAHQNVVGITLGSCDPAKIVYTGQLQEEIRQMFEREILNNTA